MSCVRILLVSTYELGHQPLHVASPAGMLRRAGHDVACLDLSVQPLDSEVLAWADAAALSVPMHTAMRLALAATSEMRRLRPKLPLCYYGLYATLADAGGGDHPLGGPRPVAFAGEYEEPLRHWVDSLAADRTTDPAGYDGPVGCDGPAGDGPSTTIGVWLGRTRFGLPARDLLPPLDRYAQCRRARDEVPVGYVEAGHGCAHRCRHCPVPVVYDGRTRLVGPDVVVADVAQLVELGARHISFGDPDFLSGPHHARRTIDAVHGAFPDLTWDVTVKVEHVLRHRRLWAQWAADGCLFVVSAFESASDHILRLLDKGHTVADELEAVRTLRDAGIEPRPSLLPFTPWSGPTDVLDLFDLLDTADLVGNVDPVQYSIRLLVPPGSLLLSSGALDGLLGAYDPERLGWSWASPDPRLDAVQADLADLAATSAGCWDPERFHDEARRLVWEALQGRDPLPDRPSARRELRSSIAPARRPRLTEAWFCCAEPTGSQLDAVRGGEADTTGPATAMLR